MNKPGLAYSTLQMLLEDWAAENSDLVRHPEIFARHAADYAFKELLDIADVDIETED